MASLSRVMSATSLILILCFVSVARAGLDKAAANAFASHCCAPGGCGECPCTALSDANGTAKAPLECQCECAEFVSRSLAHGGYDDGVIKWVPSLWDNLALAGSGWKLIGTNPADVKVADVIIYQTPEGPKMHTCIGAGNGIVNCHNNNHCGINANLGYVVNGIFRYGGSPGPAPPPPDHHECKFFVAGLCPGPADCMCTAGNTCAADGFDAAFNKSSLIDAKTGGCNGRCRKVVHGECPGSNNCLKQVGEC